MSNEKKLIIISLFGNINNMNSRVYKIDKAFKWQTTFVTPNFDHSKKEFKKQIQSQEARIKTVFLAVPAYAKNLSIKRMYSHLVFARNLNRFLKSLNESERPDIIISLMPTSTAAWIAGKFSKKHNLFFVVDVIDLWPDSLVPLVKSNVFIKSAMLPWTWITQKAYKLANYISAESKAYSNIAATINPFVNASHTYLGVNIDQVNEILSTSTFQGFKSINELILCYGGSLNNSYDFESLLNAVKYIQEKGISYKMVFIGEGEKRIDILTFAEVYNLNVAITGRVSYDDFLRYLAACDIAFNSFVENTKVVHSYKFNDYCAAGVFIFNNLKGETADAIDSYDIGVNYTKNDLPEKLFHVAKNWEEFNKKRNNVRYFIQCELDSDNIYKSLVNDIKEEFEKFSLIKAV
jgi:glycosyltransferase involved in cell wall biosynthesis